VAAGSKVTGRRAAAIVKLEDESDVLRDCDRRTDEHFPNVGPDGRRGPSRVPVTSGGV
jgi:hypothetical protein